LFHSNLFQAISAIPGFDGKWCRRGPHWLALYFAQPTAKDIEAHLRAILVHHLGQDLEPRTFPDPVREGLTQLQALREVIAGRSLPESFPAEVLRNWTNRWLSDRANAIHLEHRALRSIGDRGLTVYPDRLKHLRLTGEHRLTTLLAVSSSDRNETLTDAISALEELLEQPCAQRDPYVWLMLGWASWLRHGPHGRANEAFAQVGITNLGGNPLLHDLSSYHLCALAESENDILHATQFSHKLRAGKMLDQDLDHARLCAVFDRNGEAAAASLGRAIHANPLVLVDALAESWTGRVPEVLAEGVRTGLSVPKDALAAAIQQARTRVTNVDRLLNELEDAPELPTSFENKLNELAAHAVTSDQILQLAYRDAADRLVEQAETFAADTLAQLVQSARASLARAQYAFDQSAVELRYKIDELEAYHQRDIEQLSFDFRLEETFVDRFQSGALRAMATSGLAAAIYFGLQIANLSFAQSISPGTAAGKLILALLFAPLPLGMVVLLKDSARMAIARAKWNQTLARMDERLEVDIAQARSYHAEYAEEHKTKLDAARARVDALTKHQERLMPHAEDLAA